MHTHETIKNAILEATAIIDNYNKKLVDFETNIMLFNSGNIVKNINELSLMQKSLTKNIIELLATTEKHSLDLRQYCTDNELWYEFNEFCVQKSIMKDLLDSLEKSNNQINDCVTSVLDSEPKNNELPTSIRRRTRQAKLKKIK